MNDWGRRPFHQQPLSELNTKTNGVRVAWSLLTLLFSAGLKLSGCYTGDVAVRLYHPPPSTDQLNCPESNRQRGGFVLRGDAYSTGISQRAAAGELEWHNLT